MVPLHVLLHKILQVNCWQEDTHHLERICVHTAGTNVGHQHRHGEILNIHFPISRQPLRLSIHQRPHQVSTSRQNTRTWLEERGLMLRSSLLLMLCCTSVHHTEKPHWQSNANVTWAQLHIYVYDQIKVMKGGNWQWNLYYLTYIWYMKSGYKTIISSLHVYILCISQYDTMILRDSTKLYGTLLWFWLFLL